MLARKISNKFSYTSYQFKQGMPCSQTSFQLLHLSKKHILSRIKICNSLSCTHWNGNIQFKSAL